MGESLIIPIQSLIIPIQLAFFASASRFSMCIEDFLLSYIMTLCTMLSFFLERSSIKIGTCYKVL